MSTREEIMPWKSAYAKRSSLRALPSSGTGPARRSEEWNLEQWGLPHQPQVSGGLPDGVHRNAKPTPRIGQLIAIPTRGWAQ
jgi:hypothetical protein